MPLELQVIRASEFIRLSPRGQLNFEASKEALRVLAHACWKRGHGRALLDLRALPVPPKPLFTPSQLASLVDTFREVGFCRRHRLAVLYRIDVHGGARMFAFISRIQGWQVQAFGEFDQALLWLWATSERRAERHAEEVPIRFSKSTVKSMAGGQTWEAPVKPDDLHYQPTEKSHPKKPRAGD
jgi:hypothetical protein